jgi:hypothetical protein
MIRNLAALAVIVLSSSAFAQVIYQPVQYQFSTGNGDQTYLYGGTNPQVHQWANTPRLSGYGYNDVCPFRGYARNLHNFDGGNSFGQPSPMYDRTPIYSDCYGLQQASWFGFNEADARNEAYANAPRYFRKSDLLASAVRQSDGSLVVPATAPHYVAPTAPVSAPVSNYSQVPGMPARGQIIIIPKNLLDRPLKDFESHPDKVASAAQQ